MPNYYKLKMKGLMKNDKEQTVQVCQWNKQTGLDELVRECPKGIELNFKDVQVKESQYGKCAQINFYDDSGDFYSYYSKLGKNMRSVLMKMSACPDKIKKVVLCPSNYQGFNFIQVQVNGQYMKNPYPKEELDQMIERVEFKGQKMADDTKLMDFVIDTVIPIVNEKGFKEGDYFWNVAEEQRKEVMDKLDELQNRDLTKELKEKNSKDLTEDLDGLPF